MSRSIGKKFAKPTFRKKGPKRPRPSKAIHAAHKKTG